MVIMAYNMFRTMAGGSPKTHRCWHRLGNTPDSGKNKMITHDKLIERNLGLMIVLTVLVVSIGGLVEIVPLFFQKSTTEPVPGLKALRCLQLAGAMSICARAATTATRR